MRNELFDLWERLHGRGAAFNSNVRNDWTSLSERYGARREAARRYAWAVPSDAALDALAGLSPIIEVGAGTGYWAALLRDRGVDVLAFDIAPRDPANHHHGDSPLWTNVERADAEVAGLHPDRTLFLCWPPYDEPMGATALRAYIAAGGHTLVYIGEGEGGCTANDDFHQLLDSLELVREIDLPQWDGIHDYMGIYRIVRHG